MGRMDRRIAPAATPAEAAVDVRTVIKARVQAILDSHSNNLIEGQDVGAEGLSVMLTLARKPISNEEFSKLAKAI